MASPVMSITRSRAFIQSLPLTCCLRASVSCISDALSVNTAKYFSNPSNKAVHMRSFFTSITEDILCQKLSSNLQMKKNIFQPSFCIYIYIYIFLSFNIFTSSIRTWPFFQLRFPTLDSDAWFPLKENISTERHS